MLPVRRSIIGDKSQAAVKLGYHISLASLIGMQFQTKRLQAFLPQAPENNIKRGSFFRHK